jgi:threonine dehydrogenase-like Zn-dependent dehydrogenase
MPREPRARWPERSSCADRVAPCCFSRCWEPVAIPGFPTLTKELHYQWSMTYGIHGGGRDLDTAAMLLARNPDIAHTIITHRFPLTDAPEAFRVAADRKHGTIKVVLEVA